MQERRRVGVVPNEDREVAEASLTPDSLTRDQFRDGLSLFDAGDLLDVIDLGLVPGGPAAKALVDRKRRLEPVGVLGDEPIGRVEETLRRAAILDQRDGGVRGIALAKAIEVPQGPPAPREDRLEIGRAHV